MERWNFPLDVLHVSFGTVVKLMFRLKRVSNEMKFTTTVVRSRLLLGPGVPIQVSTYVSFSVAGILRHMPRGFLPNVCLVHGPDQALIGSCWALHMGTQLSGSRVNLSKLN